MTKNEVAVIDTKKVERAINHISDICCKVENSTEEYKKTIDDIVFLQTVKAHKESGLTFHDYIHERTGMGRTTCTYLLRIGKYMQLSGMGKEEKKDFTALPMRTILSTIAADPKGEEMNFMIGEVEFGTMEQIASSIIEKGEQEEPEEKAVKDPLEIVHLNNEQFANWLTDAYGAAKVKAPNCIFTLEIKGDKISAIKCKIDKR